MDEFGDGQVVQQSLFETNGDWHMSRALEHFVRANPGMDKLLQVIVVDKDLNEIRVLQSYFPDVRILICVFHVIKWLKLASRKPEYGRISEDDHSAVDHIVHNMIYASSSEDYETQRTSLSNLCARIGFMGFFEYMEKNWHSCQDMWVMYKREKLPHFRNHTNNRLESYFGKLKDGLDGDSSMATCLAAIVASERRRENEYRYRKLRLGRNVNANYDEEMSQVLMFTTHFVAEHILREYQAALLKCDVYKFDEDSEPGFVLVIGAHYTHKICTKTWSCDCAFVQSMKLPCRHSMAVRKALKKPGSVIPLKRIDARYLM